MAFNPSVYVVQKTTGSVKHFVAANVDSDIVQFIVNPAMRRLEITYNMHKHPAIIALKATGVVPQNECSKAYHFVGRLTVQKIIELLLNSGTFTDEDKKYLNEFKDTVQDYP